MTKEQFLDFVRKHKADIEEIITKKDPQLLSSFCDVMLQTTTHIADVVAAYLCLCLRVKSFSIKTPVTRPALFWFNRYLFYLTKEEYDYVVDAAYIKKQLDGLELSFMYEGFIKIVRELS